MSDSFSAAGVGATFGLPAARNLSIVITGTFVATLLLERQAGPQGWVKVREFRAAETVSVPAIPGNYRLNCSEYTSGTAVGTLSSAARLSSAETLENKRIVRRAVALADAATVTPNADTTDLATIAALSQATLIANPTGTPTEGQALEIRVTTSVARAITFGDQFRATSVNLPTTTTGNGGSIDRWLFEWHAGDSKWDAIAVTAGA